MAAIARILSTILLIQFSRSPWNYYCNYCYCNWHVWRCKKLLAAPQLQAVEGGSSAADAGPRRCTHLRVSSAGDQTLGSRAPPACVCHQQAALERAGSQEGGGVFRVLGPSSGQAGTVGLVSCTGLGPLHPRFSCLALLEAVDVGVV